MNNRNRASPDLFDSHFSTFGKHHNTKENIMKKRNKSQLVTSTLLLLALAVTAVFGLATSADALVAGNAQIINTATVTWTGGSTSASVTVTVNSVAGIPVVGTSLTDATVTTYNTATLELTPQTLTYYITNKGTGESTITLSDNSPYSPSGVTAATAITGVAANIVLGATVTTASSLAGATTLTVPSDGTTDASVNGITAGDRIVIGTTIYTVQSVVDNAAPGVNSATITLTTGLAANVAAGVQIGERGSVTVAFTTGTLTTPPTAGTYSAIVTATTTAGSTNATNTVTVRRPALTIAKEVSTDGGVTFGGATTANPGATLTYRITVTNVGTADALNVAITDPLPAFTTYVAASARYRDAAGLYAGATVLDDDTAGAPDDGYDWGITTGTTATYTVGTLAPAAVKVLFFQVLVNN